MPNGPRRWHLPVDTGPMNALPLFDTPFLASVWDADFQRYLASGKDAEVLDLLARWAARHRLRETASEAAFVKLFFHDMWGYSLQGSRADGAYQCHPQFPVARAGQAGGRGEADLALGHFSPAATPVPQVLCEFKDVHSGLDSRQRRKLNDRSPVQQCFDYLRESRVGLTGAALVEPCWAVVTDMNEFRLYCWNTGHAQCQRFVLAAATSSDTAEPLTAATGPARFQRFVFYRLFQPGCLLSERGPSHLAKLLKNQITREKDVEETFYLEYKAYREHLFAALAAANPGSPGGRGRLVRLAQRFLDRCIFALFCEDMGEALAFPPNLFRDELIAYSTGNLYGQDDSFPWDRVKSIFRAMDGGGTVGRHAINRFNGGLFEPLPELENLRVPARLFCAERQGESADALLRHPLTLLYFSAKYNFGIKDAGRARVIDLYALGRIFEQSITELEIMEAEADGRDSLNLLTKRKRDGVYYTPEWVTAYIVEETVGARLRDIRQDVGLAPENRPDGAGIRLYQASLKDGRRSAPRAYAWLDALESYRAKLGGIRVVDPACGSGAFLIQSVEFLKRERRWVGDEAGRVTGQQGLWDAEAVTNSILANNIYGVDVNPESIEIAKLAIWLHTATPGRPLSSLDHNIRCGNSLVAPDFWALNPHGLFTEDERDRVNAFDWHAAFPEVFDAGGFDCVVGNPPYVKLQHFRRVQDKVARYLAEARRSGGLPLYASTQTGNFDLYLPFIEKGVSILNQDGRMGFIAPSVWMVNEYGEALRNWLLAGGHLDRWVDFKSFQVFDEAITYTALQFFTGTPNATVRCAFAPEGDVARVDWDTPDSAIPYAELPESCAWNLMPDAERNLVSRLKTECKTLGDPAWTRQIFQGLITSADSIYHMKRLDNGHFRTAAKNEVAIEFGLVRPLVSGPEAKCYQHPKTATYLIFPYKLDEPRPRLFTPAEMESRFPKGWDYLKGNETALRERENGAFDDDAWYRFGRNQNIDKQETPKLCVAQTVPNMRVCYDHAAQFFFNNVRVNGILPTSTEDGWYLLGILNSPTVDFVFRRIAKAKEGGYFEANKQFIAPLPIPDATPEERRQVAESAKKLQGLHSSRRDLVEKFERRLNSDQTVADAKAESWIWADLYTVEHWKKNAPADLPAGRRTAWAKARYQELLGARLAELDTRLKPGAALVVTNTHDELRLAVDGASAIELFDKPGTTFVAAQWRHALRATPDAALASSLVAIDRDLAALDLATAAAESALDALAYRLYRLTPAEIALVAGT